MKPVRKSILKLRKLKEIRRKNLEKNLLDVQLKGQDHYVFMKDNGKTAVVKFNYEINKIDNLLIRDFTDEELKEYEKTLQ